MPKTRYQQDLQSEEFNLDPAQMLVVEHLHALEQALINHHEGSNGIASRVMSLFSNKESPSTAVRGLYIYGTVGRVRPTSWICFMTAYPVIKRCACIFIDSCMRFITD